MFAGRYHDKLLAADRLGCQLSRQPRGRHEPEVELAPKHLVHHALRPPNADHDVRFGVLVAEARDERAAGAAAGWWLYLYLPADLDVRIAVATPFVIAGLALGVVHFGELLLRDWVVLAAHFALRPRRLFAGGQL